MEAKLILDIGAILGEGAIWHSDEQRLYWIDVEQGHLHLYHPASAALRTIPLGKRIGTVVPATSGTAIVALQDGIYQLNMISETVRLLHPLLPKNDRMRFNDGKCDPLGRLWVGTQHLEEIPKAAALYVLRRTNVFQKILTRISISNGITWSSDGKTMYYIDTPTLQVQAYDFDGLSAHISSPRVVVTLPEGSGLPDGMTIDAEDMLWIAHYGGGKVGRWNPLNGQLVQQVSVPVPYVTSCAFGGPLLDTLYITTSRSVNDPLKAARYPTAGGLLAVRPGAVGVPAFFYQGKIFPKESDSKNLPNQS